MNLAQLKSFELKNFGEKKVLLQNFKPRSETWIVSDLQSKWEIQGKILESETVLEEDSVLRASEFWVKLLFRTQPEWTLISKELFEQWIWSWARRNPLPWLKANESASLIHQHLEVFAPLFIEEDSPALLMEWFQNNPDSVIKWRHLLEICELLWKEINELKVLSPALVPVVLLNELKKGEPSKSLWDRKIYLDLGIRARLVEKNLADLLAEFTEVNWLVSEVKTEQIHLSGDLKRLPTQLGEAKEAVAQVRKFLDQGVEPQSIAIFAPDIESFWPSLSHFFRVEGVPCNKAFVQRLIDDPSVHKWMSLLRIQLKQFSNRDLESYFFQKEEKLEMTFDEFRYFFETLKGPEEVGRWQRWKEAEALQQHPVSLVDFFDWALKQWPKTFSSEPLEKIWKALSKDYDPRLKMNLVDWVFYLESKLSKSESLIEEPHPEGVQLLSLSSAEWCEASHAIFLGMNEVELSSPSQLMLSKFECEKIKQDLGFELDIMNESIQELYLGWIAKKDFAKKVFLTSGVTFSGEDISPSKYWLKSAFNQNPQKVKEISSPSTIRFDELSQTTQRETEEFKPIKFENLSLSATTVKSFKECPFNFFAQKGLKLVDQPVLDFDLDPMNKGRLLHSVLEVVVGDLSKYNDNQALVEELIELKRVELSVEVGEKRIWPAMKKELTQLVLNFIHMELELRSERPGLKTLGSEVGFEFYFDPKTQNVKRTSDSPHDVKITGRIDRVDGSDDGELAIVDYKLSSGRLKGWNKWAEEGDLQMPIYSMALESGFVQLPQLSNLENPRVEAAYYLVPKSKERAKGYFLKTPAPQLFIAPSSRSRSWITEDKKKDLLRETKNVLTEVSAKIQQGELAPDPKNFDDCDFCRWRNLCRAPHLI